MSAKPVRRVAVLSDTHNREERVRLALEEARTRGAEVVLHCGDIEDPPVVELFRGWQAHFVLGNCDQDRQGLRQAVESIGATLHDNFGSLELGGVKLAFTHGDDHGLLRDLERSGYYDWLFHGHTHEAGERVSGRTRVVNPGALHRVRTKTFIVLDLEAGVYESVVVE